MPRFVLGFLLRHGFVRIVGGRLVPVLLVWDLAVIANRVRRIPEVDQALRKGIAAAAKRIGTTIDRGTGVRRDWPRR